jgi:precorrin-8X/cobalt-precorrin-8 methylmutase
MDYCRDPQEIYDRSFSIVRGEVDLSPWSETMAAVITRMIHACGMVDILPDIAASEGAEDEGVRALRNGAAIICDVGMVEKGIIRKNLPAENPVLCAQNDSGLSEIALEIGNTRSAAGIDLMSERISGAVVVIGNAPTALFRLLELIDGGLIPPALILGFPVGFVGAAESKEALISNKASVPFITLTGRRGGSPIASAALNALAIEAHRQS